MAWSLSYIILVPVLLISTFSYCSTENVYCVTSTVASCSSCPHNSTHCATLSEYAQEAEQYFTSNTTIVFLPGDHILDADITVANVSRLTMRSYNMAKIFCNGSFGFSFTSIVDFKMYSLAFSSCNRTYTIPAGVNSSFLLGLQYTQYGVFPDAFAIFFQFTQYAELVNCSFYDNFGTALEVVNTNLTLSGSNEFTHNHCGSSSCIGGGGITALNSNLTFTGNTTFLENFASFAGAGIHMTNCTLSSTGTINFIGNSAENGGAIYAYETFVSFSGTNNYQLNSAYPYGAGGGAIYTSKNSMIKFTGSSNFDSNFAPYGGAIYAYVNATLIFNGTVSFTNNGRGLNTIDKNYGGGIYIAINSTFSILPNTTINWENNHASSGGAIYVHDSPFIYCTEIVTYIRLPKEECFFQLPGQNLSSGIDVQLVFKNNSADEEGSVLYGGAVDNCRLTGLDTNSSGEVFNSMVVENNNTLPTISSDAFSVCPCKGNYHPDCYSGAACSVYPGETFYVSVAACG